MSSDPIKAPHLLWRLLGWFAIYFVGALVSYLIVWPGPEDGTVLTVSERLVSFLYWVDHFPFGIALLLPAGVPFFRINKEIVFNSAILISYGIYCFHFGATVVCRLQSRFRYLMIGLIILVSLNATSCTCFWSHPTPICPNPPSRVNCFPDLPRRNDTR